MAATSEHIARLVIAHKRRLAELELKAATLGSDTPPEITTEIEDIRLEIAKLEASITALAKVSELGEQYEKPRVVDRRDQVNYEERLHIMLATVQSTVAEFASLRKFVLDGFQEIKLLIFRLALGFAVCLVVLIFLLFAFSKIGWL